MSEWVPVRRRWFVEWRDFGREIAIVQTVEDAQGIYRFLESTEKVPSWANEPGNMMPGHPPRNVMTGNEPFSATYKLEEAQELMDALWAIGMRPTRR